MPTVAVIDTGLNWEQYPDEFDPQQVEYCGSVVGGDGGDPSGHGTQVAGCIAGARSGESQASLVSYRCIVPGDCRADVLAVIHAMELAVDRAVAIINISMGIVGQDAALDRVCRRAVDAGILVIAAKSQASQWPADSKYVVSVGMPDCHVGRWADIVESGQDIGTCGKVVTGASFAAGRVTGRLAEGMQLASRRGAAFTVDGFRRDLARILSGRQLLSTRLSSWVCDL